MKNVFLMLLLVAGAATTANAQSESKFDKNYPVCYSGHNYKLCNQLTPREVQQTQPQAPVIAPTTYVKMGTPEKVSKRKTKIVVTYDDANAPYRGENSLVNDGVNKNIERNTNYLNQSVALPANDGGLSMK